MLYNIRIKLQSFSSSVLDKAVVNFLNSIPACRDVSEPDFEVVGPVPMPKKIERFTISRSPHIDRKSMEQFAKIRYTRVIDIRNITYNFISKLSELQLSSGVGIEISINKKSEIA
ncbi:MAG: ribosomal protein [Pseudomonadota bacterium]|jgi:small subunit ribosomal protein S10